VLDADFNGKLCDGYALQMERMHSVSPCNVIVNLKIPS
jgi:hypothetical protein